MNRGSLGNLLNEINGILDCYDLPDALGDVVAHSRFLECAVPESRNPIGSWFPIYWCSTKGFGGRRACYLWLVPEALSAVQLVRFELPTD